MTRPYFQKTLTHPENSENGGTGGGERLEVGGTVGARVCECMYVGVGVRVSMQGGGGTE